MHHLHQVGNDVILYDILRSDLPVAKATVISTNPNTALGGQPLGRQFCEVVVNVVLKRDAMLPRPYADMEMMADTLSMSIAWPYKKMKMTRKASNPCRGIAKTITPGSVGRC
ncbi:uncharacterized protein LOC133887504 [Phragmites australis]|uniref:uncharacterized protein LOC133887504 n=1 Tax=Phragmites australis TaxID=29695 RepID=UPI002D7A21EF|nr:uncharacterized protein LOC133887504 [Phragmites australis]